MKKSFSLTDPKHQPERVVASIKNEVRKYVKRERRKELPEAVDFWDFACKVGKDNNPPEACHLEEVVKAIDAVADAGGTSVYVEIIATPGIRQRR